MPLAGASHGSDDSVENISLIDEISQSIKEEKCWIEEELLTDDDMSADQILEDIKPSQPKNSKRTPVKRTRSQKSSKNVKRKSRKLSTSSDEESEVALLETAKTEVTDLADSITSEVRTVHTCKFCHKDFASAFILCLHVQIHEKVNSVWKNYEENSESMNSSTISQDSAGSKTIEDGCSSRDKLVENHLSPTLSINQSVKIEPVGVMNKNFVENLKKNLSLAMNRKL